MLIDRMRESHGTMKDLVNEIVGKITKFGFDLDETGQHQLLSDQLESAYSVAK